MSIREKIKTLLSGSVMLGGVAVTVAAGAELEFVPVIIAGMPMLFGGLFGMVHTHKRYKARILHQSEQQLLEVMSVHGHHVTIAQVARMTGMPIEHIEETMNHLQSKGVVEIGTTNNGAVVYQLPQGMHNLMERQRSQYDW